MKRLYRSRDNRIIAGVCGGIGEYFGVDPVLIRVIAVILIAFGGGGLIAYIISILVIPLEPVPGSQPEKKSVPSAKPEAPRSPPETEERLSSLKRHVSFLGGLYIVFSSLALVAGIIVFVAVAGGGLISGDETVIAITTIVASTIAGFLLLFSAPGIICGLGLLKYRSWSRTLGLILGVVNLINIPFGTALGVYTLWVLLQEETETLFSGNQS